MHFTKNRLFNQRRHRNEPKRVFKAKNEIWQHSIRAEEKEKNRPLQSTDFRQEKKLITDHAVLIPDVLIPSTDITAQGGPWYAARRRFNNKHVHFTAETISRLID